MYQIKSNVIYPKMEPSRDLLLKDVGKRVRIVSNTGAVHQRIGEECKIIGVWQDLYQIVFDDGEDGCVCYHDVEFI